MKEGANEKVLWILLGSEFILYRRHGHGGNALHNWLKKLTKTGKVVTFFRRSTIILYSDLATICPYFFRRRLSLAIRLPDDQITGLHVNLLWHSCHIQTNCLATYFLLLTDFGQWTTSDIFREGATQYARLCHVHEHTVLQLAWWSGK